MIATGGFSFRKNQRLLTGAQYDRVFKKARRSRDRCFTVLVRPWNGGARLGLAISKKHCRKATGRNRLKRIVRESFRLHQFELDGLDIVVMNQPGAALASNQDLAASLERHWKNCIQAAQKARMDNEQDG